MKLSKNDCTKILVDNGSVISRMLAYNRGNYTRKNPRNKVYFCANIVTREHGKIWWGDLDLTKDADRLQKAADAIAANLYILNEMDYRHHNESRPFHEVQSVAVQVYEPHKQEVQKRIQCLRSSVSAVARFFSGRKKISS